MRIEPFVAPSYEELGPLRPDPRRSVPVYPDLVERLCGPAAQPDDALRFVLAVCAAYSYGDASAVGTIMARLGLEQNGCLLIEEHVDALLLTSTAFVIQSQDGRAAILSYRGTPPTSLITWLTDLEIDPIRVPTPGPSGPEEHHVHAGFYRNVRATRAQVMTALQRALAGESVLGDGGRVEHPLEALYITGHSLGGASAEMLAAQLYAEPAVYGPVIEKLKAVYTYGAPMIGSHGFAAGCDGVPFLAENVIRYVYADDIVPQVPPTESGSFAHFGREYRYRPGRRAGAWETSPPRKQMRNLIELLTTPLSVVAKTLTITRHIPFHASLNDHLPQYYIAALTPPDQRSEFGD